MWEAMRHSLTDQLRRALNECGRSRYELSKITGIPQSTLSRLANGLVIPNMATADRLAKVLGLELRKVRKGR